MYKIIYLFICFSLSISTCIAGSANLTIVHENPNLKVIKYIIKYGPNEKINPEEYPNTKEVYPEGGPVAIQSITRVDLGNGSSGNFYFSVRDVYSDNSMSAFSESSFPIYIPKKPLNLRVK
jgi:hypothetical protein